MQHKEEDKVYKAIYIITYFIILVPALIEKKIFHLFLLSILQLITLLGTKLFFENLYKNKRTAVMGVVFYMTMPYRIYLLYLQEDVKRSIVWSLLPFLEFLYIKSLKKNISIWWQLLLIGLLITISYIDAVVFFIVAGLSILSFICLGKWKKLYSILLVLPVSILINKDLFLFLFGKIEAYKQISLSSIMEKGYMLGEFFTIYSYDNNKPGIGFALLVSVFIIIYFFITCSEKFWTKEYKLIFIEIAILILLSWNYFPWDFIQRVSMTFLRFVSVIESPNVFWGLACTLLCIPITAIWDKIWTYEKIYVRGVLQIITIGFSMILSVYWAFDIL